MDRFLTRTPRSQSSTAPGSSNSSSEGERTPSAKRARRNFNSEWGPSYFFRENDAGKPQCLLCNDVISRSCKSNLERHHQTHHPETKRKFPTGSVDRSEEYRRLLRVANAEKNVMRNFLSATDCVTAASYNVAYHLAQKRKPFTDSELIKDIIVDTIPILLEGLPCKDRALERARQLPLSNNTATSRIDNISADMFAETTRGVKESLAWSVALDSSCDITDTEQLAVWVSHAKESEGKIESKTEYLGLIPVKDRTRGSDILKAFLDFCKEHDLPLDKLVCVCTDGCPAMIGKEIGFVTLLKKLYPHIISYHCIIHQQALCGSVIKLHQTMDEVVEVVNKIRSNKLAHRQFRTFLEEIEAQYGDVIYHCAVRWLSKGDVLERFLNLSEEIKQFIAAEDWMQFSYVDDKEWLSNVAFLCDICGLMNSLNLKLQGFSNGLSETTSAITAFRLKLSLVKDNLSDRDFTHLPQLQKFPPTKAESIDDFTECIEELERRFSERFGVKDFEELRFFARFVKLPSATAIKDVARLADRFQLSRAELESELLELKAEEDNASLAEVRKPTMRRLWAKFSTFFVTTYACEQTFSTMNKVKNRHAARLTDKNLDNLVRCALSKEKPDLIRIMKDNMKQSHPSH